VRVAPNAGNGKAKVTLTFPGLEQVRERTVEIAMQAKPAPAAKSSPEE